jgi:hypothetical protein
VLVFVFFASFLNDWGRAQEWGKVLPKLNMFIGIYVVTVLLFFPANTVVLKREIQNDIMLNTHYEDVARWMAKHIPEGQIIYHSYFSDSAYFICLNPKNNYLNFLDSIYMFYRYPKIYMIYLRLREGRIDRPSEMIKRIFKCRYGYARKDLPLFNQISNDVKNFKILYEDDFGIVFEILN